MDVQQLSSLVRTRLGCIFGRVHTPTAQCIICFFDLWRLAVAWMEAAAEKGKEPSGFAAPNQQQRHEVPASSSTAAAVTAAAAAAAPAPRPTSKRLSALGSDPASAPSGSAASSGLDPEEIACLQELGGIVWRTWRVGRNADS